MSQVKRGVEDTQIAEGDVAEKKEKSGLDHTNIFFRAAEDLRAIQEAQIKQYDEAWTKITALQAFLADAAMVDALDKFFDRRCRTREIEPTVATIKRSKRTDRLTRGSDPSWYAIAVHAPKMFERAIPGSRNYVLDIIQGTDISINKLRLKSMTKDPEWLKIIHTLTMQQKEAEQYFG